MRTTVVRRRRSPSVAWSGALVLVLVTIVPSTALGAAPSSARIAPAPLPSSHCVGAAVSSAYLGSLLAIGAVGSPPTVSNQTVRVDYAYELNFTPRGGAPLFSCKNGSATAVTNGFGGFSVQLPVPATSCNAVSCSTYSGPFGSLSFSIPSGVPAGFFLASSVSGSTIALDFVAALSHVRLTPSDRVTLSTDAPTLIAAQANAGDGSPTPAVPRYDWRLAASGWILLGGTGGPNVTVKATTAALPGWLTVWVNGTFNGSSVTAPPATLLLAAASTNVTSASIVPDALDVGTPTTFTVTGIGAAG